jgi:uncharacterized delta-60 repeat protein
MQKFPNNVISVFILGLTFFIGGNTPSSAQVSEKWVARYNGTANSADEGYSVAVDNIGNVYVAGMSTGIGTLTDYVTVKYDSTGTLLWTAAYNGPGNAGDKAVQVVVDADGNVYVTGYSWGSGTNYDYATIKYSEAGVQLWAARYNGSAYGGDHAAALAVDSDGNVYVTGQGVGSSLQADYYTIKYNSSGVQQWVAIYNGMGAGGDYPYALVLDDSSNVYVTGQSVNNAFNYDYATVKYNSSGVMVWASRYDGPGNGEDDAYALAVDGSGNVFVTGRSFGANSDYATLKYDAAGNELWVARYNGLGNAADIAESLDLGSDGSVVVTGVSAGVGTSNDYATVKYDDAGNQLWLARYNGPGNGNDHAYAVGVDEGNNVYVTGESIPFGTLTAYNYATLRYDAFGNQLWVQHYTGPATNSYDNAYSLAVDGNSNVYVTGRSATNTSSYDYLTIKYDQTPSFTIDIIPSFPPIIIPANGGSFLYDITVTNHADSAQSTQAWIMTRLPNLAWYGPVLGPFNLNFPSGLSIVRQRSQSIPGAAPAGLYLYRAYLGDYADIKTDSSSFTFIKLGVDSQDSEFLGWQNTGDDFSFEPNSPGQLQPSFFIRHTASPNPFNSSTAISYKLQVSSYVRLKVYDTTGKLVATLVDGWSEAGEHRIAFDGTNRPSGVYLYRLTTGRESSCGKLIFLK